MKRNPKLMDELSEEFDRLRFDEARHISSGIAQDYNFNIVASLEEYIKKLQAFMAKCKELTVDKGI